MLKLSCMIKLKWVKRALRIQNKKVFGSLRTNIALSREELDKIQLQLASEDFLEGLFNLEKEVHSR